MTSKAEILKTLKEVKTDLGGIAIDLSGVDFSELESNIEDIVASIDAVDGSVSSDIDDLLAHITTNLDPLLDGAEVNASTDIKAKLAVLKKRVNVDFSSYETDILAEYDLFITGLSLAGQDATDAQTFRDSLEATLGNINIAPGDYAEEIISDINDLIATPLDTPETVQANIALTLIGDISDKIQYDTATVLDGVKDSLETLKSETDSINSGEVTESLNANNKVNMLIKDLSLYSPGIPH